MKLAQSAFIATAIVGVADAINVRGIFNRHKDAAAAASESASEEEAHRELGHTNCWGADPDPAWHPVYSAGWTNGYCRFTVDCNSPAYSSELACCKGAYTGQISGYCLSQLPQPPTQSPTDTGGLDVYYPDYATPWNDAGCINARPLPSGRPTYSTMLACCKGAYAGQMSGKLTCLFLYYSLYDHVVSMICFYQITLTDIILIHQILAITHRQMSLHAPFTTNFITHHVGRAHRLLVA